MFKRRQVRKIISVLMALTVLCVCASMNCYTISYVEAAGGIVTIDMTEEQAKNLISDINLYCPKTNSNKGTDYEYYNLTDMSQLAKYLTVSGVLFPQSGGAGQVGEAGQSAKAGDAEPVVESIRIWKYGTAIKKGCNVSYEINLFFASAQSTGYVFNGQSVELQVWHTIDNWPEDGYKTYISTYAKGVDIWIESPEELPDSGDINPGDSNGNITGNNGNTKQKYSDEWIEGKWYNRDGSQTYDGILEWKQDSDGWWVQDSNGWYPKNLWVKIDGEWYYFTEDGYMDYAEYRDGIWLNGDGTSSLLYTNGQWKSDSAGWWYEDGDWYPVNQYLWIDGVEYHFNSAGYME